MSKSTALDKKAKKMIISCIDGSGYGRELKTDLEKIGFLKECFESEYNHEIERYNYIKALDNYFRGLPSVCTIPFTNFDILQLAIKWGSISEGATEKEEDKIISNYFNLMANKAKQLFDGYRVPVELIPLTIESFDYDHDVYGNPTANYSLNGVTVTKRRIQCGYDSNNHTGGAYVVIKKAGYDPDDYKMESIEGMRCDSIVTSAWVSIN